MKIYLVYKISFDSDFDACPQVYFLGLYKEKSKADEICTKDICKNTFVGKLIQTKNTLCSYYNRKNIKHIVINNKSKEVYHG